MAVSEAQLRASKKYHAKFDRLYVRLSPDCKQTIEAHAEKMGESVNAFVLRAIEEAIAQDEQACICSEHDAVSRVSGSTLLSVLELKPRAYNALRRAHIDTVEELIAHTEKELKKVPYLGVKCLAEVKTQLALHGYRLCGKGREYRKEDSL